MKLSEFFDNDGYRDRILQNLAYWKIGFVRDDNYVYFSDDETWRASDEDGLYENKITDDDDFITKKWWEVNSYWDREDTTIFPNNDGDIVEMGTRATGDFTRVEADGTVSFQGEATVWNDIIMAFDSARVPAANAPTWASFVGNLKAYTFGVNDFVEVTAEMQHQYKEGSDFEIHIHWATNGTDGTDRAVKWEVEYTIASMDNPQTTGVGEVFPVPTVVSAEQVIPADTPSLTHMYVDIADIVGTNCKIGEIIKLRVRRIAAAGTAPSSDPFGFQIGIHYEGDTVGSRTEYTK
jgi:hypothetical protein